MKRREFIAGLGGAAAWPLGARAQQPERMRRVGVLINSVATDPEYQSYLAAFIQGLRQLGWIEGKNLRIDVRWNGGDAKPALTYAAQLIGLMPDVILATSTINLTVIQQATSTLPVVFIGVADPVAQGFIASMRQPGGNVTGFSLYEFSLGGKWLGLLKEVAPNLAKVAVMFNPDASPQTKLFLPVIESAAPSFGVQAIATPVGATAEIEPALASFARQPNSGLILLADSFMNLRYSLIADLAGRYRLPSIGSGPIFAKDGGLMSYGNGINLISRYKEAATYVDRILNGAKPRDLPVQASDKYSFVINLKTAKALGLTIPPGVLAIADEVIE
jgi:putative tryptophan/tyrosine transport system substrate-binding protein